MRTIPFLLSLLLLWACQPAASDSASTSSPENQPVGSPAAQKASLGPQRIEPPVPTADVSFRAYSLESPQAATLEAARGTRIHIPAQAWVNAQGKPVTAAVELTYRQVFDPAKVILSGIPMQYDSAGSQGHFRTAGMVEMRAESQGEEVFLAAGKSIDIDLRSAVDDPSYNFYYFDEAAGQWQFLAPNRAAEKPLELTRAERAALEAQLVRELGPAPQVPRMLNEGDYPLEFDVDYAAYPELKPYQELVWLVQSPGKGDRDFLSPDQMDWVLGQVWEEVTLTRHDAKGRYALQLEGAKPVRLLAEPAAAAAGYDRVQAIFAEMKAAYAARWAEHLAQLQTKALAEQQTGRFQRSMKINQLGIFNIDQIYKMPDRQVMAANFVAEGNSHEFQAVYLVMPTENMSLCVKQEKWPIFAYSPSVAGKVIAIGPNEEIFLLPTTELPQAQQKSMSPTEVVLKPTGKRIGSPEDLRALLQAG
jgi:hypothetical protein